MPRSIASAWRAAGLTCVLLAGCTTSSPPPAADGEAKSATPAMGASADPSGKVADSPPKAAAVDAEYPDVPVIPIMTEVDGIEIPRLTTGSQDLQLTGPIQADVGNEHAKANPSEPVRGDAIRIRFNSEPKTLNPVIETSAVQTYIGQYVQEALLWQNLETFEFEPHVAKSWVVEDSIKLSADYPGKERRISRAGGAPAATLEIEYAAPATPDTEPPVIELATGDGNGKPLGKVWVGVFPKGKILGASATGYHLWSDAEGKVGLSGFPTGTYIVKTGAEVYGKAVKGEDGTLTVTAASDENPLHEELKSSGVKDLILKAGEWIDLQSETYYTYTLRSDVKWSDGTPFTTKDLEFAYAVLNNPTVDGESIRTYYADVIECQGLSPLVVRMRYRQQYFKAMEFTAGLGQFTPPYHFFAKRVKEAKNVELTLDSLTEAEEAAQGKWSARGKEFGRFFNTDSEYNLQPLGTGPYMVGRWDRDQLVELVRNPLYWNARRPGYLDKIIVKFIPDNVTALRALQSGEIDFLYRMDPQQYFEDLAGPPDWFKDKYVKADWFSPTFGYMGWNMLKPEFQDRRVRIALSMLFDKQDFLEKKLYNAGVIVSGPQYYFGPGYDHSVAPLAYSPETARELLSDAGWVDTDNDGFLDKDGKKLSLIIYLPPGNPSAQQRVELFQKSLRTVGVDLEVRPQEWASFVDRLRSKDFDICTLNWAMDVESDPYQIWHGSQAGKDKRGSNHVSFNNAQANELIEMLRVTLDKQKRQKIHDALHRIFDAEQPYMFLYCIKEFGAYHQRFRGVKWYRLRPGFDLTEWYVPKDEQLIKE